MRRLLVLAVGLTLVVLLGVSHAAVRGRRSCKVAWTAPTTYVDATPQTTLSGYNIFVSATSGSYGAATLQVGSGTTQVTCRALGLLAQTAPWYLTVTALDATNSTESAKSSEISVIITRGQVVFR